MTLSIKYVMHPGYITSENDGDKHFISYSQLIRSYGLRYGECIDVAYMKHHHLGPRQELIHLYPDPHGDYKIPKAPK